MVKTAEELLQSLTEEYEELKERYIKGETFYHSEEGMSIADNDRTCLKRQLNIMDQYLEILGVRIYNAKADIKLKAEQERKKQLKK